MHRVFVDSDIILDVLAQRDEFYTPAAKLFSLFEKGDVAGFTSPIVFANLHYILRKAKSKDYALQSLVKLKSRSTPHFSDHRLLFLSLFSLFFKNLGTKGARRATEALRFATRPVFLQTCAY
jgi:predicted nucleic acid-binding protein